jgi:hypothetical protein
MVDFLIDLQTGGGGDDRSCWILVEFEHEGRVETWLPLTYGLSLSDPILLPHNIRLLTVALMRGKIANSEENSMMRDMKSIE